MVGNLNIDMNFFNARDMDQNLEIVQFKQYKIDDLEKVYFGLNYNLSKSDAKIFFISLNDDKPEMSDNLDNLIYGFNNNSITVNNWISLRSFINKILSSYPG